MNIRLETKKDYYRNENLTREAFWNVYRPRCMEHLVLHNLRNDGAFIKELCYVIEEKGELVANIVYAHSTLTYENGETKECTIFGPISVLPKYQHKGYGSKIIEFTLDLAKKMGIDRVFITGNPEYYHRFGFESASKYNVFYEGMSYNDEASFFMVKNLANNPMVSDNTAIYKDPEVYNVNNEELEAFDKLFPIKVKETKEGQL